MIATLEPMESAAAVALLWRDLESRAAGGFFLSWAWIGAWAAGLRRPLWLMRVEEGGRVVGLGIFALHETRRHGLRLRQLRLHETGDPNEDAVTIEYNGLLIERGREDAVWAAALSALRQARRPMWDELVMSGLTPETAARLEGLGLPMRRAAEARSAYVDLAALRAGGQASLEGYVASLGKSTREQMRRAMRLYAARGPLRLEAAADAEEALRFWEEMRPFHQARWESRGEAGAFGRPFLMRMQERIICEEAPRGGVELLRASAGDQPFAWLYNFIEERPEGRRALFYMGGLAYEADSKIKPGLVAHALAAERYLKAGFAAYDFMGGDNRYKFNLGEEGPAMLAMAVWRRRPLLMLEDWARRAQEAWRARRAAAKTSSAPATVSAHENPSA